MYFYVSFLRAPPIHSRPTFSTPLPIKVQITNDLRTEFYDKDTDLYYAWTQIPVVPGTPPTSTPFTKLTTWRQSNTYTELKVYPPKDVKEGQKWQLVLCAPGTSRGQGVLSAIDLTTNDTLTNTRPFPVLSLPVLFCSKPHGSGVQGTKQEAIERILKLPPSPSSESNVGGRTGHGILRIMEHLAFDLDKKLWDSGIGLSAWLARTVCGKDPTTDASVTSTLTALLSKPPTKIIELGSGTGIVSIVLGALLSRQVSQSSSDICLAATDLPSAIPVLEHNIALNKHSFAETVHVDAAVLDWDDENLPACAQSHVDLIVMADVTYNTASFPALINILKRLSALPPRGVPPSTGSTGSEMAQPGAKLSPGPEIARESPQCEDPPFVLLAYKERDPAERTLWDMARGIGLVFDDVDRVVGAGGTPVEIHFGRFT